MAIENEADSNCETAIKCESLYRHIFLENEIGLVVLDTDCRVIAWNQWFSKYIGIAIHDVLGKKLVDIFPVLEKSSVERAIGLALKNNLSSVITHTLNRNPFPLRNSLGQILQQQIMIKAVEVNSQQRFCLIQITDVSAVFRREKKLIEQTQRTKAISDKLVREKERAHVTLDSIADGVVTTDVDGLVLSMNPVAEMLTGVLERDARHKQVEQIFKLIHEKTRVSVKCPVMQCLKLKNIIVNNNDHILMGVKAEFSITDSVAPILDVDKRMLGTVLVFRDVTQARKLSAELNWLALHDSLTGLANRRQFEISMKDLLAKAKSDDLKHHLLYLDLDQFKIVNDTCGHDAGDELLKQVTDILGKKLRKVDLLARLGGDEFGVLLEACDAEHALAVANNLRQAVEDFRFGWHAQSFRIGVSIGVAGITGAETKASEVLSAADAACYVAKESGRNRVHFHDLNTSASAAHQKEMQWVARLQAALDNDGFILYLQRIQDVRYPEKVSDHYEVLLRMLGEDGEIILPGAFLAAAERFNLVGAVDRWTVEEVFRKLLHHKKVQNLPDHLMISINLSGSSMNDDGLLRRITCLLDKNDIPAENFCFEVTETATIANLKQATRFLSTLQSKGCKIALDDFGSGLSSFTYLKELPVDYLKIDGYFVKDIVKNNFDKAFVEAINQISQVMGIKTIAEFVETDEILKVLIEIGVNYAQGYGIHYPMPFDDVFSK